MASYTYRKGSAKPHQVRYRDAGGRSRSEQFTVKRDAEDRLREVQRMEDTGRIDLATAGKQPLAKVAAEFFKLHKREWSANTAKGHAYIWNAVVLGDGKGADAYPRAEIADLPVRTIRRSHVRAFIVDALDADVPQTSIKRALSLITRTLDFAADDGLIDANPAVGVAPPKPKPRGDVYVCSPAQVEAIRAHLGEDDALIVSIMAYAGLRPAELRALEPRHIGAKTLRVEAQTAEDGTLKALKGGNAGRSVPLCKALADDLAAVKARPAAKPIFTRPNGERWSKETWANWRDRKYLPAAERAGVPVNRPYELRHSIASLWLREGVDLVTVAARLGHSVEVCQRHYAHVVADLKPSDRRKVDTLIAAARKASPGPKAAKRPQGRKAPAKAAA